MPPSQPEALSRSGSPEASPFRRPAAEGPESREVWLAPPRAETGGQELGTRALAAEAWAAGPAARAQAAPPWRPAAAAPAAARANARRAGSAGKDNLTTSDYAMADRAGPYLVCERDQSARRTLASLATEPRTLG